MNTENILELADFLETMPDPKEFDMHNYTHACNTPACFAGWGAWMQLGRPEGDIFLARTDNRSIIDIAREFFGDQDDTTDALDNFALLTLPGWAAHGHVRPYRINNKQGAMVLRHLAKTGEVNFDIAFPATDSVEEQAND